MTQQEQPNAAWARYYVAQGWAIIPIHVLINGQCSCMRGPQICEVGKDAGKHPVQAGWNTAASWVRSEAGVLRHWGDPRGIPYSIGLVCGEASGVWLLDVDPRNGGFESLERLEAEWGESLPGTRVAKTGGGGRHFYFKLPDGVKYKKGPLHKDYPGLDVQANGSQSVLPPSTHASGNRYEWITPPAQEIVEAPKALTDMIVGDRGHAGAGMGGVGIDLSKLMVAGVPEGARNDTVYKVTCSFARKLGVASDLEKQLVVGAVESFNREFVRPPLETDELRKIAGSAITFILANPGGMALDPGVESWLASQRGDVAAAVAVAVTQPGVTPLPVPPAVLGPDAQANTAAASSPASASGGGAAGSNPGSGGGGAGGGGGPVGPVPGPNAFGPGGLPPDNDSLGPDGTPGMRTFSDNGNARRLIDYFEDEVRFTPETGWYHWSNPTWRSDVKGLHALGLARELPVRVVSEVANWPAGMAPQDDILKHANLTRSAGSLKKCVDLAQSDARTIVGINVWDSDADLVGVANGVVDLRSGNLIPPRRDQYITKRTACEYRPGARDTRLSIWLDQATGGDKELQALLQRWAGYCLTAETREEKFVMLYGPAGTGKSTFLELIKAVSGDYGLALSAENIMSSGKGAAGGADMYFIAEIVGKRVIIVSELPEGEMMKEDAVKRLTGADTMIGRPIGGSPIQFKSKAKLMVGTNNRPRVKDSAMWRRVMLVPFLHVPQVLDSSLKPYLLDPQGGLPAFMAWAVEGAVQWFSMGLGKCAIVEEATAEYKAAEDELGIFLGEEMRRGDGLEVSMADIYTAYKLWLEDRGQQNAGPINKLVRALGDRGVDVDGTGRRAKVLGWTMVPRAVPAAGSSNWAGLVGRAGM